MFKMGPNDVQCVIWAINKFISPSFGILLTLITIYKYYSCFKGTWMTRTSPKYKIGWNREGYDDEDPLISFFFVSFLFHYYEVSHSCLLPLVI